MLNKLFEKYVHSSIDMIVDGIVDGKQGQKLKTVVPQTDLNMVGSSHPSQMYSSNGIVLMHEEFMLED